jgi:acyl transferase domain-containing protein
MGDNQQFDGIAIIGMAGRFPGAENIAEFWSNVLAGVESVSFFTDAEIMESGLIPSSCGLAATMFQLVAF